MSGNHHWNYFLALESDLKVLSRYVEFSEENFQVYSIELAHLLFAASAETEVILKQICSTLEPNAATDNIGHLRSTILKYTVNLDEARVLLPRFNIDLKPWQGWKERKPPWWDSYNAVKHHRNSDFNRANLRNVLYAMSALYIIISLYYHISNKKITGQTIYEQGKPIDVQHLTFMNVALYSVLKPSAEIFQLEGEEKSRAIEEGRSTIFGPL